MKGRGVRTIPDTDLQVVTPDATHKDRFVLVDAIGVTETKLIESFPLERKRGVSLEKLLHQVALGHVSEDLVSTLASRLARIDSRITPADRERLEAVAGQSLKSIGHGLVEAIDPDCQLAAAQLATDQAEPSDAELEKAKTAMFAEAVRPIAANPELREQLANVQRSFDQVIDEISIDQITRAEFAVDARARAAVTIESFRAFLDEHKDEITALQVPTAPGGRGRPCGRRVSTARFIPVTPSAPTCTSTWTAWLNLATSICSSDPSRTHATSCMQWFRDRSPGGRSDHAVGAGARPGPSQAGHTFRCR